MDHGLEILQGWWSNQQGTWYFIENSTVRAFKAQDTGKLVMQDMLIALNLERKGSTAIVRAGYLSALLDPSKLTWTGRKTDQGPGDEFVWTRGTPPAEKPQEAARVPSAPSLAARAAGPLPQAGRAAPIAPPKAKEAPPVRRRKQAQPRDAPEPAVPSPSPQASAPSPSVPSPSPPVSSPSPPPSLEQQLRDLEEEVEEQRVVLADLQQGVGALRAGPDPEALAEQVRFLQSECAAAEQRCKAMAAGQRAQREELAAQALEIEEQAREIARLERDKAEVAELRQFMRQAWQSLHGSDPPA